ncbi:MULTISPECIES: LptA/OstA family protein [Pseudomonadota]|uniref:LptA/OstA family protein n=1 Tax=Pseudomonadota TaxID=1224 RepID=UPI0009ECABC6|nr:LptA/OstA family protein [Acidovorax delafieldii]
MKATPKVRTGSPRPTSGGASAVADARSRRRARAAPGGFRDRLVSFLNGALPAAIGLVFAIMVLLPLWQRGEISFLVDRNKVPVVHERLRVDGASYRGQDRQGRLFGITAARAVQASAERAVVELTNLAAWIEIADGPARIWAPGGSYNFEIDKIAIGGPVRFEAANGYRMFTDSVVIDLTTRRAIGSSGVEGRSPAGTFSAERMVALLDEQVIALEGNAQLHMLPGALDASRLPQASAPPSRQPPVHLAAERIEVRNRSKRVDLCGNVKVTQAAVALRARCATVAYSDRPALEVQRITATGNVIVTRGNESARGNQAVYELDRRVIILQGDVALRRGADTLKSGSISIDLARDVARVEGRGGRVSGTFSVPSG